MVLSPLSEHGGAWSCGLKPPSQFFFLLKSCFRINCFFYFIILFLIYFFFPLLTRYFCEIPTVSLGRHLPGPSLDFRTFSSHRMVAR